MPTPKFNAIAIEFMSRINDPISESAGVITTGNIIKTVAGIETFVNRALHKLMGDMWQAAGGDTIEFGRLVPELIKTMTIVTTAGGIYTLFAAGVYYDFYVLAGDGIRSDKALISYKDINIYPNIFSETIEELTPSATNLFVFHKGTTLEFLPASEFNAKTILLPYIAKPVNYQDGSLFVSGGAIDSPYGYHWHDILSQMAANMYLEEAGER